MDNLTYDIICCDSDFYSYDATYVRSNSRTVVFDNMYGYEISVNRNTGEVIYKAHNEKTSKGHISKERLELLNDFLNNRSEVE